MTVTVSAAESKIWVSASVPAARMKAVCILWITKQDWIVRIYPSSQAILVSSVIIIYISKLPL